MTHATMNRRKALAAVAVAPAALAAFPALGLCKDATAGDELAALVRRYFAEVDVFNTTEHETDEEANAHAATTWRATVERMIGVPARTRDDALAALDWLIDEGVDFAIELDPNGPLYSQASHSIVYAVRDYLAGRAS